MDLTFLGFMIMENKLKKETVTYLNHFSNTGFRLIMITGDNPLTAAAVAKMSGHFLSKKKSPMILDAVMENLVLTDMEDAKKKISLLDYLLLHLPKSILLLPPEGSPYLASSSDNCFGKTVVECDIVMTGRAFQILHHMHGSLRSEDNKVADGKWTPLEMLLGRCNVFARMSPNDKQETVRSLQDLDLTVAMTGDGANDSGALKAGDIGVSIAAKESSTVDSTGRLYASNLMLLFFKECPL